MCVIRLRPGKSQIICKKSHCGPCQCLVVWLFQKKKKNTFNHSFVLSEGAPLLRLTLLLTELCFAAALGSLILIPFTIVAKHLVEHRQAIHWLNEDLLLSLWNSVFW